MHAASYADFLAQKSQIGTFDGFKPIWMPDQLFDFQKYLLDLAVRKGKVALFADCGLGKTPMQLAFAENVVRKTNGRVLVMAPLAVSAQTVREGEKFGIECSRFASSNSHIIVTNYERLHRLDPDDFVGAVCDESAILKSFDGVRRREITEFMRRMKYRLLCSATPSPNEYIELGTSAEALGQLGYMNMLSRFFKNDQGNSIKPHRFRDKGKSFREVDNTGKWRFRGHAETPFWRWVCSWAAACRKPSDLGFDDTAFILPPLIENVHQIETRKLAEGMLFAMPAVGLREQREERRRSLRERCEKAASLVAGTGQPALIWCQLNDEGDLLEEIIPGSLQISGRDDDQTKEEKFMSFINGWSRVLITKEKIGAWGLNLQHCAHVVSFPTHSFEGYYQGIRRCWRFGQTRPVVSDIVTTEGEASVLANLHRKAAAADHMFAYLIEHMNEALAIERDLKFTKQEDIPGWL